MSISRITINIFRSLTKDMVNALSQVGINNLTVLSGRAPVIQESKGFLDMLSGSTGLSDDPSDLLSFMVPAEREDDVVNYIIEKGQLDLPGRGSVYAEKIELPKGHEVCRINQPSEFEAKQHQTLREATGICCIVQRGQGNKVAKVILESGAGVPNITYGTGLGVRDKMGLLRITIPADKELIWVATSDFDADIVMNAMIEVGKLDEPGKGFIYTFPLSQALLNMQVTRESGRSAASMEQVIAAIDSIKGNIEWRRRAALSDDNRNYLQGLVELTLVCDEGGGDDLVAAAMAAGAAGASISKMKQVAPEVSGKGKGDSISKSRESCYMIIGEAALPGIMSALEEAGAFGEGHHGLTMSHSTHKAFTYLPPKKD